tara:strand:- start:554 stop:808 length:255 start_codon:yes stop_codon:yes gene_type:complete
MNKLLQIKGLKHWIKEIEDPSIELTFSCDKKTDLKSIESSEEFKKRINDALKWVQYYFLIHLEKSEPFTVQGRKVKIEKAFQIY